MPKRIANAKIACLDFSLQKTKMKLGVKVCADKKFCGGNQQCFNLDSCEC
jgi:hypothetical protein